MGQIYKIINKINGKAYIGATTIDFDGRYHGRWWANTHNHELQDDAYLHGSSAFSVEILQENVPDEGLAEAEFDLIEVHETWEPKGYNKSRTRTKFKPKEDLETKKARLARLKREKLRHDFYERIGPGVSLREAVKIFREIVGKNQKDFADLQDTSPRILMAFEQGVGNPTIKTVEKLLRGSGLIIGVIRKSSVSDSEQRQ